jgi:hypothetical protein
VNRYATKPVYGRYSVDLEKLSRSLRIKAELPSDYILAFVSMLIVLRFLVGLSGTAWLVSIARACNWRLCSVGSRASLDRALVDRREGFHEFTIFSLLPSGRLITLGWRISIRPV